MADAHTHRTVAPRAGVDLCGRRGRNAAHHPDAVGRALSLRPAAAQPIYVKRFVAVRDLRRRAPARGTFYRASYGTARAVGAGHISIVPYAGKVAGVRLVIARCSVDYVGRLKAHLPLAVRLLMVKADGSVLVHSDGGSYKPLNWMSPPARISVTTPAQTELEDGVNEQWVVQSTKMDDRLIINIYEALHDSDHDLGVDPGLIKDGVEADLQRLLAAQIDTLGPGYSLIRREYFTAIGPVDILARDGNGGTVAIELKRRGDIDGVEQLTRYLELLNRDPLLAPVRGIFAAQQIKPQARVLATDRGIECRTLDYDAMRGVDDSSSRLF